MSPRVKEVVEAAGWGIMGVLLAWAVLFASVGVIVKAAEFFGVRAIIVKIEK